jgi:hypothetical protein
MAVQVDSVVLLEAHQAESRPMFELTDEAFARVQLLLPNDSRRGKPWRDHREVLGGIPVEVAHRPAVAGCARAVRTRGRPAMAGCAAGRPMGSGPGCGRCWPPNWRTHLTIVAARRCWRRRQWQRRARAWWRRRHTDHHSTCRTLGGVHHTRATSSRRASAVETLIRSEPGGCGGSAESEVSRPMWPRAGNPQGGGPEFESPCSCRHHRFQQGRLIALRL